MEGVTLSHFILASTQNSVEPKPETFIRCCAENYKEPGMRLGARSIRGFF